jgi:hypothetical protein
MENLKFEDQAHKNGPNEKNLGHLKWLRSRDVRNMLRISDSTLQSLRVSGAIPAYKLGASWFYREDEILAMLEKGRIGKEDHHA